MELYKLFKTCEYENNPSVNLFRIIYSVKKELKKIIKERLNFHKIKIF